MTNEQQQLVEKLKASAWKDYLTEKRWCAWFKGDSKPDGDGFAKVPVGSHSDPQTWCSFDELCAKLKPGQGIGYNFLGGDLHPLDLDHVRNPQTGMLCNEAMLLLSRLKSFSEISISGRGIHVLFRGKVRGHQLGETFLQYWNPAKAPRFFTVTGDLVGDAFNTIRDVGEDFNYVFATAAHISAKCREELRTVDYEQWAKLPAEPRRDDAGPREKPKVKTRKVCKDFDIKDYLAFYGLGIDNETSNELGRCIRLNTCPIKGEPHVGHNSTTCNFIYPAKDGGLAFHCQSTGCVEYSVSDVIKKLADGEKGKYPKHIYEEKQSSLIYTLQSLDEVEETSLSWLWNRFLPDNQLVHFAGASSEGKSPVTLDLIARITRGEDWPDGTKNELGARSVILMAGEDDLSDTVKPRLRLAGADISKVHIFKVTARRDDKETALGAAIDRDYQGLVDTVRTLDDLALIVLDPITNYLGKQSMNKEEDIRGNISMPLKGLAQEERVCIVTVGHLNKRDKEATVLQRTMGAAAFTGVPRKVFLFGNHPEDDSKHAHVMTEVRDKQVAIEYRTVAVCDPEGIQKSPIIKVEWGKSVEVDADEVVNAPKQKDKSTTSKAVMLIKGMLRTGAKRKNDLDQALKENGIDAEKLQWSRIKQRCKAEARPLPGKGAGWEWFLSTPEQAEFDGNQRKSPQT
jgi:putative DNA primase/helicase